MEVFIFIHYSEDDDGYYAEVCDESGVEIHTSIVWGDRDMLVSSLQNKAIEKGWNKLNFKGGI